MKMKFKDFRADYYTFSGKASDVARQLAFAGIAVVWLFKAEAGGKFLLPAPLLVPTASFVAALGLDLLHYTFAALIWGGFTQWQRTSVKPADDDEVEAHGALNYPAIICFWAKLAAVAIGYGYLFDFVYRTIGTR